MIRYKKIKINNKKIEIGQRYLFLNITLYQINNHEFLNLLGTDLKNTLERIE